MCSLLLVICLTSLFIKFFSQMASQIVFRFADKPKSHTSVAVAGSFNGWSTVTHPLGYESASGTWKRTLTLDLPPLTRVVYKYVLDDRVWVCDPEAESAADENGNANSVATTTEAVSEPVQQVERAKNGLKRVNAPPKNSEGNGQPLLKRGNTPNAASGQSKMTFWEYLRWIFNYYILSFFSPAAGSE